MNQFKIFTKTVKVADQEYNLRPIKGEHLGLVFELADALTSVSKDTEHLSEQEKTSLMLGVFKGDTSRKAYTVVYETLKRSYPDVDSEVLEDFTTQNMLVLLPEIIELNLPSENAG